MPPETPPEPPPESPPRHSRPGAAAGADGALLAVEGLSMVYRRGPFKRGFRALDDVTLSVGRGSVFGLLGPNGAGKTTLVKVLLGLAVGWRGRAELCGRSPADPLSRRRVGYLPESHRLPPYLTGWQVLELYGMLCGRERAWLRARIPVWLDKVGMLQDAGRKVREYSKGMQQRIGLAQALVHEPELVFLDEPTDGVDPVGRAAIRDVIAELQRGGTTVFINSHLLLEVERMCDRIVILDKGRLVREGTLAELTPHTGAVRFELDALPPDLEARLAGVGKVLERGERHFVLAASDDEVGEAIDRLRRDRLVIRAIEPGRLSLEDTFIDMMTKGRA